MDRQEAIKKWMDNLATFDCVASEMRDFAKEIGKGQFICLENDGTWFNCTRDSAFHLTHRYRLRPDYTEQPEVIEVEIRRDESENMLCLVKDGTCFRIYIDAPAVGRWMGANVRFAGYKYADGYVGLIPVQSKSGDMTGKPIDCEFPVSALFVRAK